MADNLLDKASILLTPTAYDNGSMLSIKPENGDGDFQFERNSAATRVNAQGLVENVQIISPELVSNGNFSQIGTEEVLNGNFSQEGSELVTNGDFATDSDWSKDVNWSIANGVATSTGYGRMFQSIPFLEANVGITVKVSFDITNSSSGGVVVDCYGGVSQLFTGVGTHTFTTTTTNATNLYFNNAGAGANFIGSIDNVSVKEVGQNWNLGNKWSIGENSAIRVPNSTSNLSQVISGISGKTIKVSYEVSNYVGGDIGASADGNNYNANNGNGTFVDYITPTSDNFYLRASYSFEGSVTNISVKEVGQDWTFGTGWSVDQANSKAVAISSPSGQSVSQNSVASSLSNGSLAQVSFQVLDITQGSFGIYFSGTLVGSMNSTGTFNGSFVKGTETSFYIRALGTTSGSITNISVKEITDDTNIPRINYEGFSYQDTLGSELVVNGDFSVDSNWNKGSGWSIEDGKANLNNGNGSLSKTDNILEVGKTYLFSIEINSISLGAFSPKTNLGQNIFNSITLNTVGVHTSIFTVTSGTNLQIRASGTTTGSIDNVSLKEYLGQEVVPDSGCGSWLLEPQSTNLLPYSEDFSNANWLKSNISIADNQTISPNGILSSDKLIEDNSNSNHQLYSVITSVQSNNVYTLSLFAKKGERDIIQISFGGTSFLEGNVYANFDLANGSIGNGNYLDAKIDMLQNDWYKCSVSLTTISTSNFNISIQPKLTSSSSRNLAYQGDGTSGLYIWGAQLEQQSYATSYIPTNGATNTRLQDIANNSGNSSLINSTEGVLYAEIAALADDSGIKTIELNDGSSNRVFIYYRGSTLRCFVIVNNVTIFSHNQTISDVTTLHRCALKWKENDFAFYIDGVKVDSQLSGGIFQSNTLLGLSFEAVFNSIPFYGKAKALAVYKEALTDAELQSLTTI